MSNKALVVFAHGKGFVLLWSGDDIIKEYISATGGPAESDPFDLDHCGVDYAPQPDGLYIADMKLVDDGPGDWPGSRECVLQFRDVRPATAEEWQAFRGDEWPWETPEPSRNFAAEVDEIIERNRSDALALKRFKSGKT